MLNEANTRRQFLKTVALGTGAALSMPALSYGRILGANDRVTVAVMGVNDRGLQLARQLPRIAGVEIVYVADVDSRAVDKAVTTIEAIQKVRPKGMKDFRKALEDKDLDALVVAAPDHWHAPATIIGCSAGKHVYVEKPCCHNPHEGEMAVAAARKYKRVVQMGNQRRSWPVIQDAIKEVQDGAIGEVHYSKSWYARGRDGIGKGKVAPVPAWLDYELWQGPAPRMPYKDNLIHYNWHWFWNWGTGETGNNGVHTIDLSRWGLGVDFPVRVSATGGHYYADDDAQTPDTQVLTFEFPNGKYIMWEGQSANNHGMEGSGVGTSFHGSKGSIVMVGSGYKVYDRNDRLVKEVTPQNGRKVVNSEGRELAGDEVHLDNFIQSVRTNTAPNSEIEIGFKSTLLPLLGNISHRVGRAISVDPKTGKPTEADALKYWSREYAKGWTPQV